MGPVNALAQAAAIAALSDMQTVHERVAAIQSERARLTGVLTQRGCHVLPSHANFLLLSPPDRDPASAEALIVHLFDTAGLIVTRTREAGLEEFLRVSISLPEHNDLFLEAVDRFLA
jgi:histidinol-phosphate aminotransferase